MTALLTHPHPGLVLLALAVVVCLITWARWGGVR